MDSPRNERNEVTETYTLELQVSNLRQSIERLLQEKPCEPTRPEPPAIMPARFTPIPYPEVKVPYLGWQPSTKLAIGSLIASALSVIIAFGFGWSDFRIPLVDASPTAIFGGASGLFVWLAIVLALKSIFGSDNRYEKRAARIKSSPEYIRQCQEIDARNAQSFQIAQGEAEQRYQQSIAQYDSQFIPTYEAALLEYQTVSLPTWEAAMDTMKAELAKAEEALGEVYARNVIPEEYRNLDALSYLSTYMGTSQCDLATAITSYDRAQLNVLMHETLAESLKLLAQMGETVETQNEVIEDLEAKIDAAQDSLDKSRYWDMANTAIAGYAALKARKVGKKLDEKGN